MRLHLPKQMALTAAAALMSLGLSGTEVMAGKKGKETQIADPVTLISHVSVDSDQIRLGDVFTGIVENAERPIARAPGPGKQMILKATWLWRVANFYDLDWRPTSKLDVATVTRASIEIDSEQMLDEIIRELSKKYTGDYERDVVLDRTLATLHLPTTVEPGIRVRNLHVDKRNGRFTATVVAPAKGNILASVSLSGTVHEVMEVAVPIRRLMREDVIRPQDLQIIKMRKRNVHNHMVVSAENLIGKAARRTLISGKAIAFEDIQEPELVKRNTKVTIVLETDFMTLTAQGKAMSGGAKGEVIQVKNLTSKKIVEAVVKGPNEVTVAQPLQSAKR